MTACGSQVFANKPARALQFTHTRSVSNFFYFFFLFWDFLFFFFHVYLFCERERAGAGEGPGEGERIPSRLHAVSAEPDEGLSPTDREIVT